MFVGDAKNLVKTTKKNTDKKQKLEAKPKESVVATPDALAKAQAELALAELDEQRAIATGDIPTEETLGESVGDSERF